MAFQLGFALRFRTKDLRHFENFPVEKAGYDALNKPRTKRSDHRDNCDADQEQARSARRYRRRSGHAVSCRWQAGRAKSPLPINRLVQQPSADRQQLRLDPALRGLVPQLQAQFPVNAIGSLDVAAPTLAFKQHVHAAISITDPRLTNLSDASFKTGLIGAARGVVVGGPIEVQSTTGTPDRNRPIPAHALHHLPLPSRP